MLKRAFDARVPGAWVTGASIYGDDRRLRVGLEEREQAYVLAVSGKEYVWRGWQQHQVKTVLAALPPDGWTRLSAGAGTQGLRWYEWRWLPLAHPMHPTRRRWLLVRRRLSDLTDLTAYVVFAPHESSLETVVRVAGSRWTIESCFEAAKGEVGLDQYEVRSGTGWYRHMTLAMWAYALLTVLRAAHLPPEEAPKKNTAPLHPEQSGGIQGHARAGVALSVSEMRRLFWCLVLATQQKVERMLAWSAWRRWHQGIAKYWHYKRRAVS
jgi:SRSO17 transposase